MMKKIISLLLVVCLLGACCTAFAAEETTTEQKADALNLLGVFNGTDKGYELEKSLAREEGLAMIIRLMGLEKEAQASADKCTMTDVKDWAKGYVGLGVEKGITKGISDTEFGYGQPLTDAMFLTMLLRVLHYEDGKDFQWDAPYELAAENKLIESADANVDFDRGNMVDICWLFLGCKIQGSEKTIAEELIEAGAIDAEAYAEAVKVAEGTETLADAKKALGIEDKTETETGDSTDTGTGGGGGAGGGDGSGAGGDSGNTGKLPDPGPGAGATATIPNYETPEY